MQHSSKATFESYSAACGMLQLQCLSVQRDLQHLLLLRFLYATCTHSSTPVCNRAVTTVTAVAAAVSLHTPIMDVGKEGKQPLYYYTTHYTTNTTIYIICASKAMTYKVQ
eukprot:9144-Heterococcus_DN1.PRE.1